MRKRNFLIWILIGAYICWIFSNSMTIGVNSSETSSRVAHFLMRGVNHFGFSIDFNLFHHYVRKLAHFSEYALLGFLLTIAIRIAPLMKSRFLNYILIMFSIPFIDEGIQMLIPGRTSAIFDSFIDISGILAGSFVAYVIALIIEDICIEKDD